MKSTFLFMSLLPVSIMAAVNKISNVVVFGDSYSDVGNFQRWTNGPLWSENVATGWNASLHSFAYSGAVCDNNLYNHNVSAYYITPSITDQLEHYYNQHLNMDPSNTVFGIWVGVNDIHQAFKDHYDPSIPNMEDIGSCIIHQVKTAHKILKANQIMLFNIPPMEYMPYFRETAMAESRKEAVNQLNQFLKQQVMAVNKEYPALKLDLVDVHTLITDMTKDGEKFGMRNTNTAYWDDCDEGKCGDNGIDEYIWWDRTHLTGGVHHTIGNSILNSGSYVSPTSVNKVKVEKLLLAQESNIRSPIYRAQPNTGLLQNLMDDMNGLSSSTQSHKLNHQNSNSNEMELPKVDEAAVIKNEDHYVRQWFPIAIMAIFIVLAVIAIIWYRNRRSKISPEHQLLKNQFDA
ncbi:unnamed protein product [Cunninghamella blakesleeana]